MNQKLPSKISTVIDCKQGAVRAVRFNVDGNYCVTCGADKTLKLWNPARPDGALLLKTYFGHGYEVLDAVCSSDSAKIASCGKDKNVIVWDVESGKVLQKFRGHAGVINSVDLNENSNVVISASQDSSVRAWDLNSRRRDPIQVMDEATDNVLSVSVSEHEILSGSADCYIRRYDLRQGMMFSDFVGKSVTCASFSGDGQCSLVSSLDSTVRLLDNSSGELLADFTGHKNTQYKLESCMLLADTHVLSGSEDGKIYCWDLLHGNLKCKLNLPVSCAVHSLSPHPDSKSLLSAAFSRVYLWTCPEEEDESETS
ncbi:unnamed protein product [Soboliphyme baturini]|uniref:WD repeat domain-containing protein 83 n=1 Tax=Soboliphyme baturini TaxID=241478 RepID=A0A183IE88_9BILA|nr:unnamed protein product [Soboliphyme baturini]